MNAVFEPDPKPSINTRSFNYFRVHGVLLPLLWCTCMAIYVSVFVCVVISFILDVRFVDVPAGVTQEEGHTGFLHLSSAVLPLIFLARRIQPFLSLVDREVEFCVLTI